MGSDHEERVLLQLASCFYELASFMKTYFLPACVFFIGVLLFIVVAVVVIPWLLRSVQCLLAGLYFVVLHEIERRICFSCLRGQGTVAV